MPVLTPALFEPDGEPLPPALGYVVRTAECGPEARAATVTAACREAERVGLEAFGAFSITEQATAIVNTRRLRRYHQGTATRFRTVVKGRDGSGWAAAVSSDVGEIDGGALGARAAGIARLSQSPGRVPPGEYAVVLSADAVAELLACLAYVSFGGLAVHEERSFVSRTRGQRIMSPLVSVWDDGLDPQGLPVPFDCEGVRKQKVSLVEAGVPVGAVWDRSSALEAGPGHVSTGHALLPNDNFTGPLAANLFMAPGEAMPADLLRTVGRGIWVNRFWYTTVAHPMSVLVSGMTRDGTFLIEDGELGRPVQALRFISSFVDALGEVVAVSRETSLVETLWGMVRAPALAIARFHFTG